MIAIWLEKVASEEREEMLVELLTIDVFYRDRLGSPKSIEQYLEEFSEFEAIVRDVIERKSEYGPVSNLAAEQETDRPAKKTDTERIMENRGQPTCFGPGFIIDQYKLQRKIAEGGMGAVWEARQIAPIKRAVAIKLIKPSLCSKSTIARFKSERQALALLDHPNVATILDAGSTPDGHPYFVMDYVRGETITAHCDKHNLGITERLRLFKQVCDGIQHAHQKGIIHRDLKPSNILVQTVGDHSTAIVIDFGLAKLFSEESSLDHSTATQLGQVLGTIRYMSPEQADLNSIDVDSRSDIYSLGVILHELLVGFTPMDNLAETDNVLEQLNRIKHKETTRPSKGLREKSKDNAQFALSRSISVKALVRLLQRDLDWVILKAVQKNLDERYSSVASLGNDIARYLSNEALEARPPSLAYQGLKFCQRNRTLTIAMSIVVISVCLGIVSTTYYAWLEATARRTAESRLQLAEERFELAATSAKDFHELVLEDPELNKPDLSGLRNRMLLATESYYQKLAQHIGRSELTNRGKLQFASTMRELAIVNQHLGKSNNAERLFSKSLALLDQAGELDSDAKKFSALINRDLAIRNVAQHQFTAAMNYYKQAILLLESSDSLAPAEQNTLANCLTELGRIHFRIGENGADKRIEKAIKISNRLLETAPHYAKGRISLGGHYNGLANVIGYESPDARSHLLNALSYLEFEKALTPTEYQLQQSELGSAHFGLGRHFRQSSPKTARVHFNKTIEIAKKLSEQFPSTPRYLDDMGTALYNLGILERNEGNRPAAKHAFSKSLDAFRSIKNTYDGGRRFVAALLEYSKIASPIDRVEALEEAQKLILKLDLETTEAVDLARLLASCQAKIAKHFRSKGEISQSKKYYVYATESLERLRDLSEFDALAKEACVNSNFGNLLAINYNETSQAFRRYEVSIELLNRIPTNRLSPQGHGFYRNVYASRAQLFETLGRFNEAAIDWGRAAKHEFGNKLDTILVSQAKCYLMTAQHRNCFKTLRQMKLNDRRNFEIGIKLLAAVWERCSDEPTKSDIERDFARWAGADQSNAFNFLNEVDSISEFLEMLQMNGTRK